MKSMAEYSLPLMIRNRFSTVARPLAEAFLKHGFEYVENLA